MTDATRADTTKLNAAISSFTKAAQNDLSEGQLLLLERQFLDPAGLPMRPFYRHLLQGSCASAAVCAP